MQKITIEAETRERVSNGKLKTLRREGWIPAVLYGDSGQNKKSQRNALLKVNEKGFLKSVGQQRSNVIVELKWSDQIANVVVKAFQLDSISRRLIHIDFQEISLTEKIEIMVPIHLTGEAPGVKLSGGTLEHITREVRIECLPKDMPAALNVDISKLEIGQGLSVKDLPSLPGVQILSDVNLLVANVVAPVVEEVAAPAAAAPGAAEPEVIAKGKKPEEGEAAAAAGGAAPAKGAEKPGSPAAKEKAPGK